MRFRIIVLFLFSIFALESFCTSIVSVAYSDSIESVNSSLDDYVVKNEEGRNVFWELINTKDKSIKLLNLFLKSKKLIDLKKIADLEAEIMQLSGQAGKFSNHPGATKLFNFLVDKNKEIISEIKAGALGKVGFTASAVQKISVGAGVLSFAGNALKGLDESRNGDLMAGAPYIVDATIANLTVVFPPAGFSLAAGKLSLNYLIIPAVFSSSDNFQDSAIVAIETLGEIERTFIKNANTILKSDEFFVDKKRLLLDLCDKKNALETTVKENIYKLYDEMLFHTGPVNLSYITFNNSLSANYQTTVRAIEKLNNLEMNIKSKEFENVQVEFPAPPDDNNMDYKVLFSVTPQEIIVGEAVALSATTNREVGSVSLSVTKDGKPEKVIDLVSPNQKEWMAGLEMFDQPGIRTITATAKDKSGKIVSVSQPPVTLNVKAAEAKAPTAVVSDVGASVDTVAFDGDVKFVAVVNGALAKDDQVTLMLDTWPAVMTKDGNRWTTTLSIGEAIAGKRTYSAHVVGKNGLSSASSPSRQLTVLSPITIKSVVVKKDKQNVEIHNCVLGDNVDFYVTTTGATKGTSELFLVMDGKDYAMKSVDGQTWTFKAWIGEAPGGKRNYTAYARHKGTLSARPGLKSLFVAPRTRVTSIDAFMNERPTSTFSSGTPIKFVVKLDGQTDGKVVVMIDQFKLEIAKPDANGNWTASAPIWDKDGKTRTFWAYVEEGYLQGISSAKKTLTSNSDQPNSVDCGNQHVNVNDEIHLKVTTGNGGYNLVGTLAGAGGGLDMRFHALNDVVWEWAHKVKETRKGVLTATIKVEDKPEGGKVIDTFTCTYAFNGATLPTTPPVPTTPAKVTSVTYSPNPANPDFPFTVTVHTDISPAVPPMIINHNSPLHMGSDGTESTIQLDLAKDFGIPANATTGEISLVVLLHDGLGGSTNTTVKIPYARSKNQQVVKDLYDRFKAGYSSRNMAALQGLISDDWQSESDGTTLSDLEDNLRRSFKIYNQISYTISNLQIAAMPDVNRFRVSYDVRIVGTVYQPNLRHDEQSSVTEEVIIDQNGKAKIAKTLTGKFWSVK